MYIRYIPIVVVSQPQNDCNAATLVSEGMYFIASARLGSGILPFSSITWPRYLIFDRKNSHFSTLNLKPNSFIFFLTLQFHVSHDLLNFCFLFEYHLNKLLQSPDLLTLYPIFLKNSWSYFYSILKSINFVKTSICVNS